MDRPYDPLKLTMEKENLLKIFTDQELNTELRRRHILEIEAQITELQAYLEHLKEPNG